MNTRITPDYWICVCIKVVYIVRFFYAWTEYRLVNVTFCTVMFQNDYTEQNGSYFWGRHIQSNKYVGSGALQNDIVKNFKLNLHQIYHIKKNNHRNANFWLLQSLKKNCQDKKKNLSLFSWMFYLDITIVKVHWQLRIWKIKSVLLIHNTLPHPKENFIVIGLVGFLFFI